jgi:hypothetical protein
MLVQSAMDDENLDTPEIRELLRTLGARPSRSAEAARARQLQEICAMSVEERMLLALRLGRRDRAIQEAAEASRAAHAGGEGAERGVDRRSEGAAGSGHDR